MMTFVNTIVNKGCERASRLRPRVSSDQAHGGTRRTEGLMLRWLIDAVLVLALATLGAGAWYLALTHL